MRNPLRTQGGVTGLGKRGLADKGGSARPEFAGVGRAGCSGHGQGLHLAQKGFVARGGAHRARKRMETWSSDAGGEVERRFADGARGGGCCRALRVAWLRGSARGEAAAVYKWSGWPEHPQQGEITVAEPLTGSGSRGGIRRV